MCAESIQAPPNRRAAKAAAKRLFAVGGEAGFFLAITDIVRSNITTWKGKIEVFDAWADEYLATQKWVELCKPDGGVTRLIARLIADGELPGEGECNCTPLSAACYACQVQATSVPLEEIF